MLLANAILQEDLHAVNQALNFGEDINQIDQYGFTPLIEAAIIDNVEISSFLLKQGANSQQQDVTGGTALQWAVENNNVDLCQLLIEHGANPNAYNFSGKPILVMPMLRGQKQLKQMLIRGGADEIFAQDFINVKLLGHLFELVGTTDIVDPRRQFIEVDFEGFFLETTIGLIADSLTQFQNHFAARQLRRYSGLTQFIVQKMQNALQLAKYQQYRVDLNKHQKYIHTLIKQEPLIIPVAYEGHAITFVYYEDILIKCDRREDSRLYDKIVFFHVKNKKILTTHWIENLIYKRQSDQFINVDLNHQLGLIPFTELKIEAQISGNCSWANVEAVIPVLFLLILMQENQEDSSVPYFKTLALNFFHRWREWNKERALNFCIQSYEEANAIRKACKAEILATILFQRCDFQQSGDRKHIETILSVLMHSPYEYILRNYLRVYYYESKTEQGKRFAEMLRYYDFSISNR